MKCDINTMRQIVEAQMRVYLFAKKQFYLTDTLNSKKDHA